MARTKQTARKVEPTREEVEAAYIVAKMQAINNNKSRMCDHYACKSFTCDLVWKHVDKKTCGTPKFLCKLKRKHVIMSKMTRDLDAFGKRNWGALTDLPPGACVICGSSWHLVTNFTQDPACECVAHPECADALRNGGARILYRCYHCSGRKTNEEESGEEEE